MKKDFYKKFLVAFLLTLCGVSLFAGVASATDVLGIASVYQKFIDIATNPYVTGILALFFVAMGIMAFTKGWLLTFIFFGMAIAITKIDSIVTALTGATLPF